MAKPDALQLVEREGGLFDIVDEEYNVVVEGPFTHAKQARDWLISESEIVRKDHSKLMDRVMEIRAELVQMVDLIRRLRA